MTVEELVSLGGNISNNSSSACPSFINSKNYWLGSAYNSQEVWFVMGESKLLYHLFNDDGFFGVRPVIEISSSSVE